MIGGCLLSTSYPLIADVYSKVRTPSNSGQTIYTWQYLKTINCAVVPFSSTSFKNQGISEKFSAEYIKDSYLKVLTPVELSRSLQLTNIKNKVTLEVIYKEIELKNPPATWYNCNGSSPIIDPFGRIIQFESLVERAQAQGGL